MKVQEYPLPIHTTHLAGRLPSWAHRWCFVRVDVDVEQIVNSKGSSRMLVGTDSSCLMFDHLFEGWKFVEKSGEIIILSNFPTNCFSKFVVLRIPFCEGKDLMYDSKIHAVIQPLGFKATSRIHPSEIRFQGEPWLRAPFCCLLGLFVGDEIPTQLCGDYFINHEIRILIKQPV